MEKRIESNRVEYKQELTDGLEKEVVAFLNYRSGGIIYIGIDKNGECVGIENSDDLQLKIKDRLKHNILPSCMGLFDVVAEEQENKDIIKLIVASGSEKPYYIKKKGMSEKGCFIRVGSASEPMQVRMIENLFAKRTRNSIGKIISPRQELSFAQLKIYYEAKGLELNKNFATNLEMVLEEKYNYVAYLMADNNGTSIKLAKYSGLNRVDLLENNEYGYCSLIKSTKALLDKLEIENKTFAKITSKERIEQRLWDSVALREAVVNAIVHNDYTREIPPKLEIFPDRLEITSYGGLFEGMTKNDFFEGLSLPRNKELMRIFKDLDMVEQLGSGIPRILQSYSRDCFVFGDSFTRMIFPAKTVEKTVEKTRVKTVEKSDDPLQDTEKTREKTDKTLQDTEKASEKTEKASEKTRVKASEKTSSEIIILIKENPNVTIHEMSKTIGVTARSIERNIENLKKKNLLKRIGADKGGYWEVVKKK